MSEFEHEQTIIVANVFMLVVLGASVWLWGQHFRKKSGSSKATSVETWSQNWIDFWIMLWALIIVFVAVSILFQDGIFRGKELVPATNDAFVTWPMVLFSLSVQLALAIVVVGGKAAYSVRYFLRNRVFQKAREPLTLGLFTLIRFLPILWGLAALSSWGFEKLGVGSGEQETVTLFFSIQGLAKFGVASILAVVLAPLLEELFFRGLILRFLVGKFQKTTALLVSAALFSLVHFNLDSFLPIFLLGFLLGWIYLKSGDIRASIFMHALFNAQTVVLIAIDKWIF